MALDWKYRNSSGEFVTSTSAVWNLSLEIWLCSLALIVMVSRVQKGLPTLSFEGICPPSLIIFALIDYTFNRRSGYPINVFGAGKH